jgi:hypothetical protein
MILKEAMVKIQEPYDSDTEDVCLFISSGLCYDERVLALLILKLQAV